MFNITLEIEVLRKSNLMYCRTIVSQVLMVYVESMPFLWYVYVRFSSFII